MVPAEVVEVVVDHVLELRPTHGGVLLRDEASAADGAVVEHPAMPNRSRRATNDREGVGARDVRPFFYLLIVFPYNLLQ